LVLHYERERRLKRNTLLASSIEKVLIATGASVTF